MGLSCSVSEALLPSLQQWELASAPANLWVWATLGPPIVQRVCAWSSVPLSWAQGHCELQSDPVGVFLEKSKRREATYCCSEWDQVCIWQDSFVNLCNKVILTNDQNRHIHISRKEQREVLCIFYYQVKKIDLIDKALFFFLPKQTIGSLMSLSLFFVRVKANEGLHCFIGPWGVLWDSKKELFAWEDTSWASSYSAVVGGRLVSWVASWWPKERRRQF